MAAEGDNIIWFTYTGADGEVIPREATHIIVKARVVRREAFFRHQNIVEVICHEDVEKIERWAFGSCYSLRRLIMRGVKVVENNVFDHCPALEHVECDKLEIIGEEAFSSVYVEWSSLRSISLPSARIIQRGALANCHGLENVKFGSKLERIEGRAFNGCYNLDSITIPLKDGLITADDIFMGCRFLYQVVLVDGELHDTIAALHLGEWRNDMREEIESIYQILTPAGGWDADTEEEDHGEKAQAIRGWIRSVIQRLNHYKAEHRKLLKEATTLLELALWKANLVDNEGDKLSNEGLRMTRGSRKRARKEICVTSGASIVIKNVLPFLQLLE